MKQQPTFRVFGEHGILVDWEARIDRKIHDQLIQLEAFVVENFKDEIIEVVPSYHSLVIYLKKKLEVQDFMDRLQQQFKVKSKSPSRLNHLYKIPVCYDGDFGPDLEHVASHCELTKKEVIALHSKPIYKVYFLGFLPGFPYLGGLHEALTTPRRDRPRDFVPKGAVGIGGKQTGIYSAPSPGGWNIIGESPLPLFDSEEQPPALLQAGDFVQFVPVNKKRFLNIETAIQSGIYELEREVYHD